MSPPSKLSQYYYDSPPNPTDAIIWEKNKAILRLRERVRDWQSAFLVMALMNVAIAIAFLIFG